MPQDSEVYDVKKNANSGKESTDIKKNRQNECGESSVKGLHPKRQPQFFSCRLEFKSMFDNFSDRGPGPIC